MLEPLLILELALLGLCTGFLAGLLGTLAAHDLVERMPDTGRYRLGVRLLQLGTHVLARLDVRYVIVGHSERRLHHGEDDGLVARKARAVLSGGLRPIVCVGEGETARESGQAKEVVLVQVRSSLVDVDPAEAADLVIAYEPVWAIGTGRTATPDDAQEMAAAIRGALAERYDDATAAGVRILYGGSVKPANIRSLMALDDVDGVLVGGASLSAEDFALIVGHRRGV